MRANPYVTIDPMVLNGAAVIVGSKVPVRRLWAWHRGGTSVETLIRRYPNLGPAKVLGALAWAYDNVEVVTAELERESPIWQPPKVGQ